MNWETYKILTDKQKEEYNYRFKERETFNISTLSIIAINLFLIVVVILFLSYLIVTTPALEEYKSNVSQYVTMSGHLLTTILIFIVGYVVEFLVRVLIHGYQYYKWQKENKIVFVTWWTRWRK